MGTRVVQTANATVTGVSDAVTHATGAVVVGTKQVKLSGGLVVVLLFTFRLVSTVSFHFYITPSIYS